MNILCRKRNVFINDISGGENMDAVHMFMEKAADISKKGWLEARGRGTSQIGITYELLLGKEPENFEWPDFYGIEIKTHTKNSYKSRPLSLFRATPDNTFFEVKRLVNEYGIQDRNNPEFKSFYLNVSCCRRNRLANGYQYQLVLDRKNEELALNIYDTNGILVDSKVRWSFKMLEEKLMRKLSYLAYVQAEKKIENQSTYFKYDLPILYRLRGFETFLSLIEKSVVFVTFSVGVYKGNYRYGEIYDHGTIFRIYPNKLPYLFENLVSQSGKESLD